MRLTHRLAAPSLGALLLVVLLLVVPVASAAQDADDPIAVYQSPEFGYLFWWDAADWTVTGQETGPGFDAFQLADDDTQLIIQGFTVPGLTAEACLQDRLAQLAATPDLTRFDALESPGDAPSVAPSVAPPYDDDYAVVEYVLSDGTETFAAREMCSTIVPNEVLLFTSTWITAEAYNANVDNLGPAFGDGFDTDRVLRTLSLPRSHWAVDPDTSGLLGSWNRPFNGPGSLILSFDGTELGMLSVNFFSCTDSIAPSAVLAFPAVVIENTGADALTIRPDSFIAVDYDGRELDPPFAQWISPRASAVAPVTLQPGAIAIARLDATYVPKMLYIDPTGTPISLGGPSGCGGGALPVRIATD